VRVVAGGEVTPGVGTPGETEPCCEQPAEIKTIITRAMRRRPLSVMIAIYFKRTI
jgi:hypothetical protein